MNIAFLQPTSILNRWYFPERILAVYRPAPWPLVAEVAVAAFRRAGWDVQVHRLTEDGLTPSELAHALRRARVERAVLVTSREHHPLLPPLLRELEGVRGLALAHVGADAIDGLPETFPPEPLSTTVQRLLVWATTSANPRRYRPAPRFTAPQLYRMQDGPWTHLGDGVEHLDGSAAADILREGRAIAIGDAWPLLEGSDLTGLRALRLPWAGLSPGLSRRLREAGCTDVEAVLPDHLDGDDLLADIPERSNGLNLRLDCSRLVGSPGSRAILEAVGERFPDLPLLPGERRWEDLCRDTGSPPSASIPPGVLGPIRGVLGETLADHASLRERRARQHREDLLRHIAIGHGVPAADVLEVAPASPSPAALVRRRLRGSPAPRAVIASASTFTEQARRLVYGVAVWPGPVFAAGEDAPPKPLSNRDLLLDGLRVGVSLALILPARIIAAALDAGSATAMEWWNRAVKRNLIRSE